MVKLRETQIRKSQEPHWQSEQCIALSWWKEDDQDLPQSQELQRNFALPIKEGHVLHRARMLSNLCAAWFNASRHRLQMCYSYNRGVWNLPDSSGHTWLASSQRQTWRWWLLLLQRVQYNASSTLVATFHLEHQYSRSIWSHSHCFSSSQSIGQRSQHSCWW